MKSYETSLTIMNKMHRDRQYLINKDVLVNISIFIHIIRTLLNETVASDYKQKTDSTRGINQETLHSHH